jgi:pyrroline-5-carboxylate reductase
LLPPLKTANYLSKTKGIFSMNKIIIIGAGNMGLAMGKGLLLNPSNIVYFKTTQNTVLDKTDFACDIAQKRVFFNDDSQFFKDIHNPWIILAVKPKDICSVILDIKDILDTTNPKAIISVAAGIDIQTIAACCPKDSHIIRTMPNISVASGHGVVGYFTDNLPLEDSFKKLCASLGMVQKLESEQEFHLFTALAGSGPAYFFHAIEAMAEAACRLGMDYAQATHIATQVFLGSASLLGGHSPTDLRHSVTSPNGTTQAGLEILMNPSLDTKESHLATLFCKTLEAAKKRSQNMT